MALETLQADFIRAIFSGDAEAIAAEVSPQGRLDAGQRVGIYRNGVHGTLRQYLASLYPVCEQLLGEPFFRRLADGYIDATPPVSPFLGDYGGGMAGWMATHEKMAGTRWVADMATLEWARHQAWNGVNQPRSDFAALAGMDGEQQAGLCFQLPGSAHLLHSAYALHQVWVAHQPEDYPGKIPLEQVGLFQAEDVLVWRAGRSLRQVALSGQQTAFLQAVQGGLPLGELAASFQHQLSDLLAACIQNGWIVSFKGS